MFYKNEIKDEDCEPTDRKRYMLIPINIHNFTGFLNETQFANLFGCNRITIAKYRKRGNIIPIGFALNSAGVRPYYHPRQIQELKKKLGINLEIIDGILSEK